MSSLNRVILIGNVGKDPETRYTQNGTPVSTLSLATSTKNKSGEELTEWHRVIFFERLAEIVGEYVKKGHKLCVEGFLRTRKWTDKDGVDRYTTEITCTHLVMLTPKESGAPAAAGRKPPPKTKLTEEGFPEDDIPF